MLHPAEFISLLRSDLLLPGDTLNETAAFYVHIRNPKTARFARKQHCKIDDPCVLAYVAKVFGALAPNASLFAGGTSALSTALGSRPRQTWNFSFYAFSRGHPCRVARKWCNSVVP